jgi:hypothetical protein
MSHTTIKNKYVKHENITFFKFYQFVWSKKTLKQISTNVFSFQVWEAINTDQYDSKE